MDTIHKFEERGLGKAPFKWIRVYADIGPRKWVDKKTGIECQSGAPGQPMGTCDYCGTGIMYVNVIRSTDGKESDIGSDCIRRICEKNSHVTTCVDREVRRMQREKRHEREQSKIVELRGWLADTSIRIILDEKPHPTKERAALGESLLSWAEWMLENAGNSGRCRVWSRIKKLIKLD